MEKVKQLATKYSVDYVTAKKAWDKVLRDLGKKEPEVTTRHSTVGGVQLRVTPEPKEEKKPGAGEQQAGPAAAEEREPTPEEAKELNEKIFTVIHQSAGEALFSVVEAVWGVEVRRPDVTKDGKEISIDDPKNPYSQAGKVWAEVAEAYGWKVPKIILLVGAIATTGQLFALPLVAARAEKLKKEEEKAAQK